MNGKTKIVAAVAAGAVALTIGAGAARCSMNAPDAQNGSRRRKSRRRESKTTRRQTNLRSRRPMSGC